MTADFADVLRGMMRTWGWPEWRVLEHLPRVLRILEGVGILIRHDGAYMPTELAEDEATWDRAWKLLEREGIAGPEPPAG